MVDEVNEEKNRERMKGGKRKEKKRRRSNKNEKGGWVVIDDFDLAEKEAYRNGITYIFKVLY